MLSRKEMRDRYQSSLLWPSCVKLALYLAERCTMVLPFQLSFDRYGLEIVYLD